jgi:DNA-binding transcriptional regulator YiaG
MSLSTKTKGGALVSRASVAAEIGVSVATIRRWEKSGDVAHD